MFLASSYSGDVRDLPGPGHRRDEGKAKVEGAGGRDASVKEVIDLLERVSIYSIDGRSSGEMTYTGSVIPGRTRIRDCDR